MADARAVANRFIELAAERGQSLTPMQILKLVYIAHGWTLGLTDKPLIDQNVEAWQYGPVVRDVYNAVRAYGKTPVNNAIPIAHTHLDASQENMIKQVWQLYGGYSGIALSNITHMANTPWANTYVPGSFGVVISDELIKAHYKRLSRERTSNVS